MKPQGAMPWWWSLEVTHDLRTLILVELVAHVFVLTRACYPNHAKYVHIKFFWVFGSLEKEKEKGVRFLWVNRHLLYIQVWCRTKWGSPTSLCSCINT